VEDGQPALDLLGVDGHMRLVAALLLALVLAGCTGPTTPPTPSPTSSPTASASESAAPARPVKNGCHRLSYEQAVAPVVGGTDVSCQKKHTSQTYKIGRLSLVSAGHLVAVDSPSVQESVAASCTSLLGAHVGGSPEDLRLSMVQAVWFTPSVEEAAAGADWFRCDVVALATTGRLAALPRSSSGLVGSSSRFAMCGTAPPGAAAHRRVPCSAKHSWVAIATVALTGKSWPSAADASRQMESACRAAARDRADDPLDFTWSEERPSRDQWDAGQRYGLCWLARQLQTLTRVAVVAPQRVERGPQALHVYVDRRAGQKPSLRSWRGSRCQSLAILMWRSR
jgi:Septum formation